VAGSDAYLHLDRALVVRVEADGRPTEGSEIRVSFDRRAAHLFDETSGERVDW
jgi:hypothetical protein